MDGVGGKLYCVVRRHWIVYSKASMETMVGKGKSHMWTELMNRKNANKPLSSLFKLKNYRKGHW